MPYQQSIIVQVWPQQAIRMLQIHDAFGRNFRDQPWSVNLWPTWGRPQEAEADFGSRT